MKRWDRYKSRSEYSKQSGECAGMGRTSEWAEGAGGEKGGGPRRKEKVPTCSVGFGNLFPIGRHLESGPTVRATSTVEKRMAASHGVFAKWHVRLHFSHPPYVDFNIHCDHKHRLVYCITPHVE